MQGGADATATAQSLAQAIATAIATAYASASSKTTVQGGLNIFPTLHFAMVTQALAVSDMTIKSVIYSYFNDGNAGSGFGAADASATASATAKATAESIANAFAKATNNNAQVHFPVNAFPVKLS